VPRHQHWFEIKNQFEAKVKPEHKVMLKLWFQTKFKTSYQTFH